MTGKFNDVFAWIKYVTEGIDRKNLHKIKLNNALVFLEPKLHKEGRRALEQVIFTFKC